MSFSMNKKKSIKFKENNVIFFFNYYTKTKKVDKRRYVSYDV